MTTCGGNIAAICRMESGKWKRSNLSLKCWAKSTIAGGPAGKETALVKDGLHAYMTIIKGTRYVGSLG